MEHVKVNADLVLLGDVGLDAAWCEDGLLIVQPSRGPDATGLTTGVRLILDAQAADQLIDVLTEHHRPRTVTPLRAIAGGA